MKSLHKISFMLVAIGAINWGLIGLFNLNLVTALFGGYPALEQLIYVLMGAAGVYLVMTRKHDCKICAQ